MTSSAHQLYIHETRKRHTRSSLALPPSPMSSSGGPYYGRTESTPPSILKNTRHIPSAGDLESDSRARTSLAHNRIDEETAAYKRRVESYRQAQHQQALLVARLQSKLLQYKQRCSNLETKLGQSPSQEMYYGSPGTSGLGPSEFGAKTSTGPPADLEDALWRLEQEKIRNDNLMQLNQDLRAELDDTRRTNESLSSDLQRLSDDWEKLTEQMAEKEKLWKAEEQAYSDYYTLEHTKLLNLWKKVAAAKRDFAEMKSSTGRDLAHLKNSVTRLSNQISSGVITALVAAPSPQQEAQQSAFIAQLTQEVHNAQQNQENLRKQVKEREERIANLEASTINMEEKMQGLDADLNRLKNQDLAQLHNNLKEIGKMLISDFDQHGLEDGHDVHLTSSPGMFAFDESSENPVLFAESVVSAVQAILNKRQLQIHQLQVSLSSAKEQSLVSRGHVESLETDLHKNEEKLSQLITANEKLKDELATVKMEKETAQRGFENAKTEKNILETQRKALAGELESALKAKANLSASLSKLEKSVELNRDEASGLTAELEKVRDELALALSKLKLENDLNGKIRDQLIAVNEDKERNASENKTLKNQVNELANKYEDLAFQYERSEDSLKKWKMDAEILAEKLKSATERNEAMDKEKRKWQEKTRELEECKKQVEAELADARNDLGSLRRETLEAERTRTDLESKLEKLTAHADGIENRKNVLENELESQREEHLKEINLMSERIYVLTEELNQTRMEQEEILQQLEKTRGDAHAQEKMHTEALHLIESKDATLRNLSNSLEKLKDEKFSLEELEESLKTAAIEKDKKIESLQKEIADTKARMISEVDALKDKLTKAETETKLIRDKADQDKNALENKFTMEIASLESNKNSNEEKLRTDFEAKLRATRAESEGEKRNETTKLNNEINSLKQQIENLRVQYEEALLRAENDKQQGLLLAQQDQQGLADKIRLLERELDDAKNEKDRLKRDCESKCTHERNNASTLRSEVIKLKNELETAKQDNVDSVKEIEKRLQDIEREREDALMQVEELRNKLHSSEEREAEIKRELNEIHRRLRDTEASGDHCKKELTETRRSLTELTMEKEKTHGILESLKEELSRREQDIASQKRELNKVQNQVKNLERLKSELEGEVNELILKLDAASKEKSELTSRVEEMEEELSESKSRSTAVGAEVGDLKLRLEAESERRDEAEARWRNSKKLLEECETKLAMTKQEEGRLSQKLSETEDKYASKESHFHQIADEFKQREKKLLDEKHNLNVSLMSLQQQMEQQIAKVAAAEHRVKLLTDEKAGLERLKRENEAKLGHIQSGFKRLGLSPSSMENPESARRAVNSLQTQMASLQQDRDTIASQLSHARDSLTSLETSKSQLEDQVTQLSRTFQSAKGENKAKDVVIFNMEKEMALKNNELSRMADKVREMEDTVKSCEESLRSLRMDKDLQKEELEKARHKIDEGRAQTDSKLAKAEVQVRALEGDLNRLTLVLQQKDSSIQALEDRCSLMQRTASGLEERCASLTLTVEQLNISLEKAGQSEQDWKDKYNNASRLSSENSVQNTSLNERLRSLQRDKALLEQERNTLNEKWEASVAALQDFKRQVQVLSEKNQKLRYQSEEMTSHAIEKQLKMVFSESGKEDLRQLMTDKLELQRKVESLQDRIRDLERENRELERLKDSIPLKTMHSRAPYMHDNAMKVLEEENSDLRRKVSKQEAEIRDLERRHTKHISEVTSQVRQERDFELERAKASKLQAERLLEAREGNYRQQVQRLEQQVSNLKEQLAEEIRRRQAFLSRSFRTAQDVRHIRQALGDSLRNVSMDPNTMDIETRRLDSTLDLHKSGSQSSLLSPMRDRAMSPGIGLRSSTSTPK